MQEEREGVCVYERKVGVWCGRERGGVRDE